MQVVEDKNLSVFASLRVARGALPAHVLSFNAPHTLRENSLDFILCWQCTLALRLFEREADQRFQIASSPRSIQQFEKIPVRAERRGTQVRAGHSSGRTLAATNSCRR